MSHQYYAHIINDHFEHVFESPVQVGMCGDYPIIPVTVEKSTDGEHWGWEWYKPEPHTGRISMIYRHKQAVELCFPYGIKKAEEEGEGKIVQLLITRR